MRRYIYFILSLLLMASAVTEGEGRSAMIDDIHWLGHDTFKIIGEKVIYTDPFKIKKKDNADIILITMNIMITALLMM